MKVKGFNMFGMSKGEEFIVCCKSFKATGKTFQGSPIYELEGIDFSTLEGSLDGLLIEVEEVKET